TTVTTTLPPGEYVDWRDGTLYDGGQTATLPAPLVELPLLLVDGGLIPMYDASIDTLAPSAGGAIGVDAAAVGGVYDVVGARTRGCRRRATSCRVNAAIRARSRS